MKTSCFFSPKQFILRREAKTHFSEIGFCRDRVYVFIYMCILYIYIFVVQWDWVLLEKKTEGEERGERETYTQEKEDGKKAITCNKKTDGVKLNG